MTTLSPVKVSFERILVPTDFSDTSDRAVKCAKFIAKSENSQLLLAHVNEPSNPIAPPEGAWIDQTAVFQRIQVQLEEIGGALRSEGFRAEVISVTGALQDEIVSIVKRNKVDLIVLGTHGASGLERLLFGSDAETILRHVPCPVLTLGPAVPAAMDPVWRPKNVVCATTLDPDSAWIAAYAYTLARQFDAQFALFHVSGLKGPMHDSDWERFEDAFTQHLPADLRLNLPLQTLFSDNLPSVGIVDFGKKMGANLIVMGASTASPLATHFMHGVASSVFSEARCPIMTLRQR